MGSFPVELSYCLQLLIGLGCVEIDHGGRFSAMGSVGQVTASGHRPLYVETTGFGAALDYVTALGMDNIAPHERDLRDYAAIRLAGLNWVQGQSATKAAIFSMTLDGGAHPHDISTVLDKKGGRGAGRPPLCATNNTIPWRIGNGAGVIWSV